MKAIVNDTELTQRGGVFTEGDGASGQSLRSPPLTLISKDANDTESTQRGARFIYRGEIGVVSTAFIYTQHDTSRVCFTSLARRFPEHENP